MLAAWYDRQGAATEVLDVPFWPLLFANVTLQMMGSDDFPAAARQVAVHDLTTAAASGALKVPVAEMYSLAEIAEGHNRVDAGGRGRVLLAIPRS